MMTDEASASRANSIVCHRLEDHDSSTAAENDHCKRVYEQWHETVINQRACEDQD
jgi:hypothetical protein